MEQDNSGQGVQTSNILGEKISLITNAKVRYEGILVEVDPIDKAMTLKNVKGYGTEGRRDGENEIPAFDKELANVKFKVDLIIDFKIVPKEEPQKEEEEEEEDNMGDPAIMQITEESNKKEEQQQELEIKKSNHSAQKKGGWEQDSKYQSNKKKYNQGEMHQNPKQSLKQKYQQDFDFSQQRELTKDEQQPAMKQIGKYQPEENKTDSIQPQEQTGEGEKTQETKKPAGDGFFDDLSSSNYTESGRKDMRQIRQEIKHDRQRDFDTFGHSAENHDQNKRGGRGRGNNRGGRGRGNYYDNNRGNNNRGGRGNYQNYDNNNSRTDNYNKNNNNRGSGGQGRGSYYDSRGGGQNSNYQGDRGSYQNNRGSYQNNRGQGGNRGQPYFGKYNQNRPQTGYDRGSNKKDLEVVKSSQNKNPYEGLNQDSD